MLYLLFYIKNEKFIIEGNKLIEIIPNLKLKPVIKAPDYVTGMLNYRGEVIPIIDINKLCTGNFAASNLSSRIVIIKYNSILNNEEKLGILVEKATETISFNESELETAAIKINNASYFGKIKKNENEIIQLLEVENILPQEIRNSLYTEK